MNDITLLTIVLFSSLLLFFGVAKRFAMHRSILRLLVKGLVTLLKRRFQEIVEVGPLTIIKRNLSKTLDQPYTVKHLGDALLVEYRLGSKVYKLVLPKPVSLPKRPAYFIMDGRENVTARLEEFIGPNHDFHNLKVTPRQLGFDRLTIFFDIGDKTVVEGDDHIPPLIKYQKEEESQEESQEKECRAS